DRHAEAAALQARQHLDHLLGVLDEGVLGDLEVEARRLQAGLLQDRLDVLLEARVVDLAQREIGGQRQVAPGGVEVVPAPERQAGLAEHHPSERQDQADLLGEWDEACRRDQAALRVVPAQQRLEAAQAPAVQLDDRLEDDAELAARLGLVKVGLEAELLLRPRQHRLVEDLEAAAAGRLGAVHRRVGVAQQVVGTL